MSEAIERYIDKKRRVREDRDRTYEERRAYALQHGTRITYLMCPLCGKRQPLRRHRGQTQFILYDPEHPLIQVSIGGGRYHDGSGVGFFLLRDESLTLEEMREEYPEVYENLRSAVLHLVGFFEGEEEEE